MMANLIETLYFDEFCNINSYHYSENMNRLVLLKELKSIFVLTRKTVMNNN